MFVKSKMSIPVKYYKGSNCILIKPNTITYVEDGKISAKELRDCYGQRIEIISGVMAEVTPEKLERDTTEVIGDIDDSFIEDVLNEIDNEEENEEEIIPVSIDSANLSSILNLGLDDECASKIVQPTEAPTEAPTPQPTEAPTEAPKKVEAKTTKTKSRAKSGKGRAKAKSGKKSS